MKKRIDLDDLNLDFDFLKEKKKSAFIEKEAKNGFDIPPNTSNDYHYVIKGDKNRWLLFCGLRIIEGVVKVKYREYVADFDKYIPLSICQWGDIANIVEYIQEYQTRIQKESGLCDISDVESNYLKDMNNIAKILYNAEKEQDWFELIVPLAMTNLLKVEEDAEWKKVKNLSIIDQCAYILSIGGFILIKDKKREENLRMNLCNIDHGWKTLIEEDSWAYARIIEGIQGGFTPYDMEKLFQYSLFGEIIYY